MPAATRLAVLESSAQRAVPPAVGDAAAVLRVLGDPTRLSILGMLAHEDAPLCVCHVEARFALAQPTISHHLRVLREARLVTTERRGTWVYYAIDRARVAEVAGLDALLRSVGACVSPARGACCP